MPPPLLVKNETRSLPKALVIFALMATYKCCCRQAKIDYIVFLPLTSVWRLLAHFPIYLSAGSKLHHYLYWATEGEESWDKADCRSASSYLVICMYNRVPPCAAGVARALCTQGSCADLVTHHTSLNAQVDLSQKLCLNQKKCYWERICYEEVSWLGKPMVGEERESTKALD